MSAKPSSRSWFILIILSIVWGSSFILMKRGLDSYSSDEVAALRMAIAFLFLSPLLYKYRNFDLKKNWLPICITGFFGNFFPAFLFTAAETQISSSLTGMLNALTPLFTVILASLWLRTKISGSQLSGIVIGLIAAFGLMYFDTNNAPSKNALYGLLVVAATICYAISITCIKKYLGGLDSVGVTTWACTFTGPVALVYLFVRTDFLIHSSENSQSGTSLMYICILAIVGTALSVIAFNYLIREAGAVFASTCTYLIPVVAIAWGLIDYEAVNSLQVGSILVIIGSVYLINRPSAPIENK